MSDVRSLEGARARKRAAEAGHPAGTGRAPIVEVPGPDGVPIVIVPSMARSILVSIAGTKVPRAATYGELDIELMRSLVALHELAEEAE